MRDRAYPHNEVNAYLFLGLRNERILSRHAGLMREDTVQRATWR
jgi:hypothetical protein